MKVDIFPAGTFDNSPAIHRWVSESLLLRKSLRFCPIARKTVRIREIFIGRTIMKLKIGLLLLIVGGGTWAYGWSEGRVSEGTNEQAAAADLAKLEAGGKPDNNHITIGGHTA